MRKTPRRRAAETSALAAGILVVAAALVAVFGHEIREIASPSMDIDEVTSGEPTPEADGNRTIPDASARVAYVEADVGFPGTGNPLLASTSGERTLATLIYRSIFRTDDSGDPVADLAVDWEVSADGTTYTLELDPNARWHDGEPVTVSDVLFTISVIRDAEFPGDRELSLFWRAITPLQTGEHTVEFTLMEPYVGFGNYLTVPILPKHELGDILPADLAEMPFDERPVGNGPYRIESADPSVGEVHLSRVDAGQALHFEDIIFRYYETREETLQAFQKGDVHGISHLPIELLSDESSLPEDAQILGSELAGYTALYFNMRHPYFRDTDTRRAIEAAIDRDALVESVLDGHAIPGDSPIPRMSSAYAPGSHQNHDLDAARQLLEEDGWVVKEGDEVRQREGEYFRIPLIVNGDDPQRIAVANFIQEQLSQVGISVDVQIMPSDEIEQALASRQFTAVLFGWRSENGNLDCFQLWHSSQGEDGANFTGFADAEADEKLLSARRAATIEERNEHYLGFQKIFAEQVPAVVLFYPRYHFAVSGNVAGAEPHPLVTPGDRARQMPNWYAKELDAR